MKTHPKICHLITRMILGGAQENTLLTLQALKELKSWELHLAYGPELDEGDLLSAARKLQIHLHPLQHLRRNVHLLDDFRACRELQSFFETHRFDLVHTHSSKAGILGRITARKSGIPRIVHTIHGLAFDEHQSFLNNILFRTAERIASRSCHQIVAVCEAMKSQALQAGLGEAVPIRTIYSGFPLQEFLSIPKREPDGRFVVGMIARMFPMKGHEDLMALSKRLLKKWDNLHFYVVGDGPLRPKWDYWLRHHPQWKHRFSFPGRVPPDEIPLHFKQMDLVVHLSWREGLPRTVAQALAAAKPVCAYDVGGTSEIVEDGVTGFLVAPGDYAAVFKGIEQIRVFQDSARQMGEKGRMKVQSLFSMEKMNRAIIELYKEMGLS